MTDLEKGSLIILCAVIVCIIVFLAFMLYFTKKKENEPEKKQKEPTQEKHGMPYEDIKKFLPFDDIKDNNIIGTINNIWKFIINVGILNREVIAVIPLPINPK